jgi:phosphoglycolate phosphatase
MTSPAAIVFDLDGTLIDSAPDIRAIANAVLAEVGAAPITLAETRSFVGNGAPAFVSKMRAARGLPDGLQAELLAAFVARYETAHDLTEVYPGVRDALAGLAGQGHRLGLCTNKPEGPARTVLAHLGLDTAFATLWGGDSLPVRKPDPAPLMAAFAALGPMPRIYVGDSEVDAETAVRAEVPFLLFTEGYRKTPVSGIPHAAAFDDFAALPALVADVLAGDLA